MTTIGIIGGFGPETTAEFYMSIVNKNRTSGRSSHPNMLIHNVPVPFELEESAIKDGSIDKFLPLLLESVRLLQVTDIIALPCNTLHIFMDDIRKASVKPVLSIPEEVSKEIRRRKMKKVGLLATKRTVSSGILESELGNVSILKPSHISQSRLSNIIHQILNGKISQEMKEELIEMVKEFENEGAEGVILGCTDIQLALKQSDVNLPIIDTMEVLSEAVFTFYKLEIRR